MVLLTFVADDGTDSGQGLAHALSISFAEEVLRPWSAAAGPRCELQRIAEGVHSTCCELGGCFALLDKTQELAHAFTLALTEPRSEISETALARFLGYPRALTDVDPESHVEVAFLLGEQIITTYYANASDVEGGQSGVIGAHFASCREALNRHLPGLIGNLKLKVLRLGSS